MIIDNGVISCCRSMYSVPTVILMLYSPVLSHRWRLQHRLTVLVDLIKRRYG